MPNEAQALPHPQVVFMPLLHPIHYARSAAVWRKETPTKSLDKYLKISDKRDNLVRIALIQSARFLLPWISSVLIHGEFFKAQRYTRGVRAC
jgi:hypothetical protein